MIDSQKQAFREACALVLDVPIEAILWDGEPVPDAGDVGFLVTLNAKTKRFEGIEDERRETYPDGERTVTVHHQRDVIVAMEVKSYRSDISAYDKVLELSNGLLDEGPSLLLDGVGLGLVEQLGEQDLSFLPDKQAMGRGLAEHRYNAVWERIDATASKATIDTFLGFTIENPQGDILEDYEP